MLTLTTEYGTFEAETEKQLLALARKAKREFDKEEARKQTARDQARLKAAANAYFYLKRHVSGESQPRHSMLVVPTDKDFSRYVRVDTDLPYRQFVRIDNGAEFQLYRYEVEAVLIGVDGIARLIWTIDDDGRDRSCLSVACHDGEVGIEVLPDGILAIADFAPAEV